MNSLADLNNKTIDDYVDTLPTPNTSYRQQATNTPTQSTTDPVVKKNYMIFGMKNGSLKSDRTSKNVSVTERLNNLSILNQYCLTQHFESRSVHNRSQEERTVLNVKPHLHCYLAKTKMGSTSTR